MQAFRLVLAAAALALSTPVAPAGAIDVVGDDATDSYSISGAVLLDGSFTEAQAAATCVNCHWRIIRTCGAGVLEDRTACVGIACPSTAIAEVWRADAPTMPPVGDPAWTYRGTVCVVDPPLPIAEIGPGARELAVRTLPTLDATSQPARTTLTGLVTYFSSGQPAAFRSAPASVAGTSVVIRATPLWTWDFGQGAPLTTADPDGRRPSGQVRHTYPRRGIHRVRVVATWRAVYDVRGITDIPIGDVITQSDWFDLRVLEARRFLRHKGV